MNIWTRTTGMMCPYCKTENIVGTDTCENCMQDLSFLAAPDAATPLEASIIRETLSALRPRPPLMVSPDATVAEAIALLHHHNTGCVLVGTSNHIVGIFTERDVLLRVSHRYEELLDELISNVMTPEPEMLDIDVPIAYALNRMSVGDFRHVPVTDDGRIVGVISVRDLLDFLHRWYPDLIPARPDA